MRNDARLYREAIVQALRELEEEGVIEGHKISYKQCVGRSIVVFLSISGLSNDLRVEFIPGLLAKKARGSANSFQVSLSSVPQLTSVRNIRDGVKREIRERKKGSGSEAIAAYVLLIMMEKNELIQFFKTDRRRDIAGIDYTVLFLDPDYRNMNMPLQIKSSEAGQKKHEEEHPEIPSARIEVDDSYYTIRQKFLKIRDAFVRREILHI